MTFPNYVFYALSLFYVGFPCALDCCAISTVKCSRAIDLVIYELSDEMLTIRQNEFALSTFVVVPEGSFIFDPVISQNTKVRTVVSVT